MSSKKSFNTFIDKVKKKFFTREGDAVWKKFVDDIIPAALFGDSGCNGYNTNILKEIAYGHSYALEFRIRALFVLYVPARSLLPVYWPHEKSFFVNMSNTVFYPISLNDFALEMYAHSIAWIVSAQGADENPCSRQYRIHSYAERFGSDSLERLNGNSSPETARQALDVLAIAPLVTSFDNFPQHPLFMLYKGNLSKELLVYFDGRIRRAVQECVRRCAGEHRQCEAYSNYIFLVTCFMSSASERGDVQRLFSEQISFILGMHKEYGVSPIHRVYSLGSWCVPELFSILYGESFSQMRHDITLFILETSPELLIVGKNIVNAPAAIQGTRLMLESLSPEDGEAAERITTLLDVIEKQNKDILHNRQEQDKKDKRVKDAFVAASNSVLTAMYQSIS